LLAARIAAILTDRTPEQIYAELTHKGHFRYISRRVLPGEAKRINDLGEPAIHLKREAERLYPNLNLAAHALGYTDIEGKGQVGLEKQLDGRLSDPATRGTPVQLAMDARVQQALQSEIGAVMADQRAEGAAGVVLDVKTGEVIALASLPDFNPNVPGHTSDDTRYNKVTYGVYELGSTFKAITLAMAIDTGIITSMDQKYDCTHPLMVAGYKIHDDHPKNRWLTVPEIFIHSSNIGTAQIAEQIGRDRQRDYLDKLGFLEPVKVELPERARPHFPPVSNWGELATMTIGYGHGIAVSPLHLATAYAALVNGGILRPATMLKVPEGQVPEGKRVFTEHASNEMRALLRMVVTAGTGRKADAPGYRVGGKTGTAEKATAHGYAKNANISTFAAAFPMDAPRYVVIATLDDPKGSKASYGFKTAGMTIAPAMSRLIQRIGPILGVTPDPAKDIDIAGYLSQVHDKAEE
jgi:cell division protein FtsI (penicillin-binding protein 3)